MHTPLARRLASFASAGGSFDWRERLRVAKASAPSEGAAYLLDEICRACCPCGSDVLDLRYRTHANGLSLRVEASDEWLLFGIVRSDTACDFLLSSSRGLEGVIRPLREVLVMHALCLLLMIVPWDDLVSNHEELITKVSMAARARRFYAAFLASIFAANPGCTNTGLHLAEVLGATGECALSMEVLRSCVSAGGGVLGEGRDLDTATLGVQIALSLARPTEAREFALAQLDASLRMGSEAARIRNDWLLLALAFKLASDVPGALICLVVNKSYHAWSTLVNTHRTTADASLAFSSKSYGSLLREMVDGTNEALRRALDELALPCKRPGPTFMKDVLEKKVAAIDLELRFFLRAAAGPAVDAAAPAPEGAPATKATRADAPLRASKTDAEPPPPPAARPAARKASKKSKKQKRGGQTDRGDPARAARIESAREHARFLSRQEEARVAELEALAQWVTIGECIQRGA